MSIAWPGLKSRVCVLLQMVDKSRYAAGDNSLEREIQVLCKVDHPNCIKLYAVYIMQRKVYIVTELVTGGELLDRWLGWAGHAKSCHCVKHRLCP